MWKFSIAVATSALVGVAFAQAPRVVNIEQASSPDFYSSNISIEGPSAIAGEPALLMRFKAQWAQFGVKYQTPKNWSAYTGYSVKIQNLENRAVSFGIMFDRNAAWTDYSHINLDLRPYETKTFYVDFSGFNPLNYGLRSPLPALSESYSHRTPGNRPGPIQTAYRCHIYLRNTEPARVRVSSVYGIQANNSVVGLIDGHGQLARKTWDWKVPNQATFQTNIADEQADLASHPGTGETLGATGIPRTSHRGSWRLFKTAAGKSYFLSPEGRYFWSLGVCRVGGSTDTVVEGREQMFSDLPAVGTPKAQFYGTTTSGTPKRTFTHHLANLYDKYGETWASERYRSANRRMKSWGFNTIGSGGDLNQLPLNPLPFTISLSTAGYQYRLTTPNSEGVTVTDPYGGDFINWMKAAFLAEARGWLTNPMLLGAYVDGEKPWGVRNGSLRDQYQLPIAALRATATQPAKTALINQLVAKYQTIAALNAAWGTSYASWTALRTSNADLTDAQILLAKPDLSVFLYNFAKIYSYRVRVALTSLKQGLIYLGGREHLGRTPEEAMAGILNYTDVISISQYEDAADVPWSYLASLSRPVMIAEFSYSSQEGNALPQAVFPQVECMSQAARAAKAREFLAQALQTKNIVGAHWFQYADQPITGRSISGENYAWGMVDVTDQPYQEMVDMFRSFSSTMYAARGL